MCSGRVRPGRPLRGWSVTQAWRSSAGTGLAPTPKAPGVVPLTLCRSLTGSICGRASVGPWRPALPPIATACATHRPAAYCRRSPDLIRSTAGRLGAGRPTRRAKEGGTRPGSRAAGPRPLTPGDRPAPGLGPQHRPAVRERRALAGHDPREPPPAQQTGPLQALPGATLRRGMHQRHPPPQ